MPAIRVICGVIIKDNLILAVQRSERMRLALYWEFPGGKVVPGESDEECLTRELKEELNIEVKIVNSLIPSHFVYSHAEVQLIPFIVNIVSGEVKLTEHKAIRWLTIPELTTVNWAPADWAIVEQLKSLSTY